MKNTATPTTTPGNTEHVQEAGTWEEWIKWIEMREYENALLTAFMDRIDRKEIINNGN